MAEQYTLATPISGPSRNSYRILSLLLDVESSVIHVNLRGSDNVVVACEYLGQTARDLLSQLNTMDFSTTSLQKRLLQRLQADGKLPAGEVSGTPD